MSYPLGSSMSLRHSSAFMTEKGRFFVRLKKCRFSDISASAPTHSAYAAIKASAGFNPMDSYLKPVSNGTTKFSSIVVKLAVKLMKSLYDSGARFLLTSSAISLGSLIMWRGYFSRIVLIRTGGNDFGLGPKEKMYSLESRTRSNLFVPGFIDFLVPELFARFPELLNNLFFGHALQRAISLSRKFTQTFKMLFCLFDIRFHVLNIAQTAGMGKQHFDSEPYIKWGHV